MLNYNIFLMKNKTNNIIPKINKIPFIVININKQTSI